MMPELEPRFLLVTTQTWTQVTRLALRLLRYGGKVSALCPEASELHWLHGLEFCGTIRPGALLSSLEDAIATTGATHLLPCDDLAVWLLHQLSEQSEAYRLLVERSIGPAQYYPMIRSRSALLTLARSLGLATPETCVVNTPAEAERWADDHFLPFLLKKDGTFGGGGVRIVEDRATLASHCERIFALSPARVSWRARLSRKLGLGAAPQIHLPADGAPRAEISAQAWVEGVAANAMFACDRGRILGSIQARVVASKGKTGPSLLIRTMDDDRITKAGELLAAALELSGFFGLDFILDDLTGEPMLIEMNPRCTQLGHVAISGQAELAGLLWAEWSRRPAPPAGGPELSSRICFHPLGRINAAGSPFLASARLDVCAQDRVWVDRLAEGSPALSARCLRAGRRALKALKYCIVARPKPRIHYFESDAAPNTAISQSKALDEPLVSAAASGPGLG